VSEDPTKDIEQKYDTKPTIETVLERINALDQTLNARMDKLQDQVNIRLDRIESEVKKTHSEFYDLRADFRELRSALIEHIPALKT
jgi:predicted nuclease with TOPRIM domain